MLTLLVGLLFADIMTVYKVVDGDTIYFKNKGTLVKCRVAYIDTPESKRNAKAKRDARNCLTTLDYMVAAGKEATLYAKSKMLKGSKHSVRILGYDRYQRAICEIDNYNHKAVQDGYAYPYFRYIPKVKRRKYKIAVKLAKMNKNGLWQKYQTVMKCLEIKRQKNR